MERKKIAFDIQQQLFQNRLTQLLLMMNFRKPDIKGCFFPMVLSTEFHLGQYMDDDHREDAPHFTL